MFDSTCRRHTHPHAAAGDGEDIIFGVSEPGLSKLAFVYAAARWVAEATDQITNM